MQDVRRERYRIGELLLDVGAYRLTRDGHEISLPKLSFDFLTALTRRAPNMMTTDELMADVWAGAVVNDETVTQRAKLLRNALADEADTASYVETVRGTGYRLAVEVEPLGVATPHDGKTWRRPRLAIAGGLVAAAIVAIVSFLPRDEVGAPRPLAASAQSIAVLPFANMSGDVANEPFTVGIHDDVLTQIAKIGALKVISRTSVERLDRQQSIPEIGQTLGAAHVLEGAVQRIDNRVRINVQLIDARIDEHLWAESYDRQLTARNVFEIQSEIAASVARHLQATLSPAEERRLQAVPTANFEAYEAYLLGQQRLVKRTTVGLADAVDYFERAVSLDPDFALAHARLAAAYWLQVDYGGFPADEMAAKAETAVGKALELDGELAEAHASLGLINLDRDRLSAEAALERALELHPNYVPALRWYALLLDNTGRQTEALDVRLRARLLDPLSLLVYRDLAASYREVGRFDEAIDALERIVEIDPEFTGAHDGVGHLNWTALGRLDKAYDAYVRSVTLDPDSPVTHAWLGQLLLDLGDDVAAERWARRSIELAPDGLNSNFAMESLYMFRGDEPTAADYARRVLDSNPRFWPSLTHLRNDDMRAGRFDTARDRYAQLHPQLLEDDPDVDGESYRMAIDLAAVLLNTGEADRAEMLLDRALVAVESMERMGTRGSMLADAQIYALRGERGAALAALTEAFDAGWRANWWYYRDVDPSLNSIRNDPEFRALMAKIEADTAAQLARVRQNATTPDR